MSFLKQQLTYETGISQPQLKCGVYVLESEYPSTEQSQNLQFKDGYLSKDDQDEVVNSNMEIIRRDGWILDVQRLDGTKVPVHVPERKVNKRMCACIVWHIKDDGKIIIKQYFTS